MAPVQKNDIITLKVDRISSGGGRGVGRFHDFVVFIPLSVPGDFLRAKVTKLKKSYAEAEIIEILEPSPTRVQPQCEYFGRCGGCSLQMMGYEEQLSQKDKILSFGLKKDFANFVHEPIQASPEPWRYRNRIQLHQEGKKLGFKKRKSAELVFIKDCLITDKNITQRFQEETKKNLTRRFELALTLDKKVVVRQQGKHKDSFFSQVNEAVNLLLVDYVLNEFSKLKDVREGFDLYCGSGNFSFALSKLFNQVNWLGVELSEASIKEACAKNKFDNLKFMTQDVGIFLQQLQKGPDFMLVDPPRQGMGEAVVEQISILKPKYLFYVSCDPNTALRDLKYLKKTYDLVKVKAFDMFPQTDHMECFYKLVRVSE